MQLVSLLGLIERDACSGCSVFLNDLNKPLEQIPTGVMCDNLHGPQTVGQILVQMCSLLFYVLGIDDNLPSE